MSPALRITIGGEAARAGVLRRDMLRDAVLPAAMQASIAATFGAPLTAAEAVARIIADVRADGDAAVRRYSQRFDGSADAPMEVTPAEFDLAFTQVAPELLAAGVPPGPPVGAALARIRSLQLDGAIATKEEALAVARRMPGSATA